MGTRAAMSMIIEIRAGVITLPPMRRAGHAIEIDVHHTILPITARVKPDPGALLDAAVSVPGSRFHILAPSNRRDVCWPI